MGAIVLGAILVVVGLVLACDVAGLGSAWKRANFGWRRSTSYFWGLAGCGAFFVLIGVRSLH